MTENRHIPTTLFMLLAMLPLLSVLATEPSALAQPSGFLAWLGSGLLSASLILMVREPSFATWFGGLERMYRWHHGFGTLSYVALLGHALSLAVPSLPADPALAWQAFAPWTQSWIGISGWAALLGLMVGLLGTFATRLRYSLWRPLHATLAAAVVLGIIHAALPLGFTVSLGLLAVPAAVALCWRFLRADYGMSARPYEVGLVSHLTSDIAQVSLRPLAGSLSVTPGQFVLGAFFEGPHYKGCGKYHPFTVTGAERDGTLTITVKALGDCTRNIQALEPGVAARIQGPYGRFLVTRPSAPELWIAGGIGITPFIAVLRAGPLRYPTTLIYAFREIEDAAYLEELASLAHHQPLLEFRPLAAGEDIRPIHALLDSVPDLSARQVYLCGPPPLRNLVVRQLRSLGLPSSSIHTEIYDLR